MTKLRATCPNPRLEKSITSGQVRRNRFAASIVPLYTRPARTRLRLAQILCGCEAVPAGGGKLRHSRRLLCCAGTRGSCHAVLLTGTAARSDRADDLAVHGDGDAAFGRHG